MAGDILGKMHQKLQFEVVYREHWRKIYNYVYGRLLSAQDAEEVTADVFIAAWENWEKYDASRAKISTWLGTIAHNKLNDYFRKAYRRKEMSVEAFPESMQPTAEEAASDGFDDPVSDALHAILQQLTDDERELLELRYALDLGNEEVASILGASANAVSHRYRRLLEKCRKLSEQEKKFS